MPSPRRRLAATAPPDRRGSVLAAFAKARERLEVPEAFPDGVMAAASEAARRGPVTPPGADPERVDRTDLPLLTIDPPGSRDLDQAVHVARLGGGFVVHYAIADVAAFVTPGGPVDTEARERGVTRYSPDLRTPLHLPVLSEDAASLLPDRARPAVLWRLALSGDGALQDSEVLRATVRSRAQLTYEQAQRAIDDGSDPLLLALSEVGRLRAEREWARGGISLELPEQEIAADGAGLTYRAPLPVERWNAQVSLLTGMTAAAIALEARTGILRTLPPASEETLDGLRRQARALGLPWPSEVGYAEFVRTLDASRPVDAAMLQQAAKGLRGAGYAVLGAGVELEEVRHAAIAAPYTHATAPLRRLVDRYAQEVALAASAGREVPGWVLEALPELPGAMGRATQAAAALERAVTEIAEAAALADRVGDTLPAVVVGTTKAGRIVQLRDPAVVAEVPWLGTEGPAGGQDGRSEGSSGLGEVPGLTAGLGREIGVTVVDAGIDGPTLTLRPAELT